MAKKEITSGIDAANRLVEIGDTVAFMESRGQTGQDILVAKVVGFSPKKIRLAYKRHSWRDAPSESITKYPHQCVRIDYKPADLVLALKHSEE